MAERPRYGQYCPLSMAAEIIGTRWTLLILRELLEGSTSFNDISRGVPLMSRTLLSQRLKEFEEAGLVTRIDAGKGRSSPYQLTEAGRALGTVVRSIAEWGQEWIEEEPSLEDIDVRFLMWDIRRNVRPVESLPPRFTVRFDFEDAPDGLKEHWLVFEQGEVDLCYVDPGHEVDVHLETDLKTMTRVWMGWKGLSEAVEDESLLVTGDVFSCSRPSIRS